MSGVVLRCPNCGTTQSVRGECEACHEAQIRYYCTNHSPGRWLDGQACSQCGAVYGRSGPSVRPSRQTATPRPESPKSMEAPPPSRTADWRRPSPWGRRPPPIPPAGDYVTEEAVERAKALERLRELMSGAYWRRRPAREVDMSGYPAAPIAGGCLRVVVIIFLMLALSYCSLLGPFYF